MHYDVNDKDQTGALINQLQVMRDDVAFLNKEGVAVDLSDYPFLARSASRALLNKRDKLCARASERVERAGFWFSYMDGCFFFYFDAGTVRVPAEKRLGLGKHAFDDWRIALEAGWRTKLEREGVTDAF